MGSSAVTERKPLTASSRRRLLQRIGASQAKVDNHLRAAEEWKAQRYELVEQAKSGGVQNKEIADVLGMTVPGVVKLIERGREASNGA